MVFAGTAVVTEKVLDLLLAALGAAHWGVVPVVGRDTKGSSGVILLLDALWVMVLLALAEVAKNLLGLFLDQLEVAPPGGDGCRKRYWWSSRIIAARGFLGHGVAGRGREQSGLLAALVALPGVMAGAEVRECF